MPDFKYYKIYKPFNMLSQFKKEGKKGVLGELYPFQKDIYPVGRLDADSEGLLILTNDGSLNHKLLKPSNKHSRSYLAQVEGAFTKEAANQLERGVTISVEGKQHQTRPAKCEILLEEPELPPRNPPIRYRKTVPTTWIRLTLHEGKNRQVRKMTAKVGFPTLRLVRESIENININGMKPGDVVELKKDIILKELKIK